MRINYFFLLFIIISVSNSASAKSWLDIVQSGYTTVEKIIGTEQFDSSVNTLQAKALPTNKPDQWLYSYFIEPVFNSQMVVLETGVENKKTMLLVHGLGQEAMISWLGIIPYFEDEYHIIAIDLPGFGLSAKPDGRYSPTNYAKILKAVVDRYSKEKLIVMGHSMGGAISLRFAAMYPEKVKQLILVDAAGILEKTAFVKHIARLPVSETSLPDMFRVKLAKLNDFSSKLIEFGTYHDGVTEFLHNSDAVWDVLLSKTPIINAGLSLVEEDFSRPINKLKIQTAIIWGENDPVAPLRTAKVLDAHLNHSYLQVIEEAGHVPMKSHRYQFISIVKNVLSNPTVESPSKKITEISKGVLNCNNKSNLTYRGKFDSIELNNCNNIKLVDVTTNKLVINDSLVNIENLMLSNRGQAMSVSKSVVVITNAVIKGNKAISLSSSRIDMAGVSIIAGQYSIYSDTQSKVVFSVSNIDSDIYTGFVNGIFKLKEQTLDNIMAMYN